MVLQHFMGWVGGKDSRIITHGHCQLCDIGFPNFTKAIALDSSDANYFKERGEAKSSIGSLVNNDRERRDAIVDYTKAIELNPNYEEAYYFRGDDEDALKDYKDAIADYTKAIELNPQYEQHYIARGLTKDKIKDYQGAIDDYTKAIDLGSNSSFGAAYAFRGQDKLKLGDKNGACSDFHKAIELGDKYDALPYINKSCK